MATMIQIIRNQVEGLVVEQEAHLKKLKMDLETALPTRKLKFLVRINSSWAAEGEKPAEATANTVSKAMKLAAVEFRKINNRSNIDGEFLVYGVLETGRKYPLPKKVWEKYRNREK